MDWTIPGRRHSVRRAAPHGGAQAQALVSGEAKEREDFGLRVSLGIFLVGRVQFRRVTGEGVGSHWGPVS